MHVVGVLDEKIAINRSNRCNKSPREKKMKLSMDEKHFLTAGIKSERKLKTNSRASFFNKNERFGRFFTPSPKSALSNKSVDRTEHKSETLTNGKSRQGNEHDKRSQ